MDVVPQVRRPSKVGILDFISVFVVFHQKTPLFFLEIKPTCHIDSLASRVTADEQLRGMFALLSGPQTPILHGMSVLGPRMSHHKLSTSTCELSPYQLPRRPSHVTDTASAARWNTHKLQNEGRNQFREVVLSVKDLLIVQMQQNSH